jgi:hypothetical protein
MPSTGQSVILRSLLEFGLQLVDHKGVLQEQSLVRLNKAPKQGSWFNLGDGTAARCTAIRIIGGEQVIFASLDKPGGPPRLRR